MLDASVERLYPAPTTERELMAKHPDHWERYLFAARRVRGDVVVDCACGSGYGSALLRRECGALAIGMDIDATAVHWAQTHYRSGAVFVAAGLSWPLKTATIDTVVSLETLEHLTESESSQFVSECARVLKPDGLLIMSTPLNNTESRFAPANRYHLREYSWDEFEDCVSRHLIVAERWTQRSRLAAGWSRVRVSPSGVGRLDGIWRAVRAPFLKALSKITVLRSGDIAPGYRPHASVQIIIARKASSGVGG